MQRPLRVASAFFALALPFSVSAQVAKPLSLLPARVLTDAPEFVAGNALNDCQPRNFDPRTSNFTKLLKGGYVTSKADGGWRFAKNPWGKLRLPERMTIDHYAFECDGWFSSVLEVKDGIKRKSLYTHVVTWNITPDKKHIYLDNYVKQTDGRWKRMHRIIDVATRKAVNLPNANCTESRGTWSEKRLITHGATPAADQQEICVWEKNGTLVGRMASNLVQSPGDETIAAPTGMLPGTADVLYTVQNDFLGNRCFLILQELSGKIRIKAHRLDFPLDEIGSCAHKTLELDVEKLTFDGGSFRYRVREDLPSPWTQWFLVEPSAPR